MVKTKSGQDSLNYAERWQPGNLDALNRRFEGAEPEKLLRWALHTYQDDVAMATGFGVSGVVLMDMVARIRPKTTIFYLNTDLLFPETLALRDQLAKRLDITFTPVHSAISLGTQSAMYGEQLWKRSPDLCCKLRKVEPLRRFLVDKKAWLTGIRRDQSDSRANTPVVGWDEANRLLKLAPLASWTKKDVWKYIHEHDLPYNPLLDQGYTSLGCMPCTQRANCTSNERASRWVGFEKIECGIHM